MLVKDDIKRGNHTCYKFWIAINVGSSFAIASEPTEVAYI